MVTAAEVFQQHMQKPPLTEHEIAEALCSHLPDRRAAALTSLFRSPKLRQLAIAHAHRHGGNRQDGEDLFQDAILIFDRKTREGLFRGEGNLEAFFMGIVRWHWLNTRQKTRKSALRFPAELPDLAWDGSNPEMDFLLTERRDLLEKLLAQLGDKCRTLLKLYQLDWSMEEIAAAMGYANRGVAKKEAFLCRQRFRALLERCPELGHEPATNLLLT